MPMEDKELQDLERLCRLSLTEEEQKAAKAALNRAMDRLQLLEEADTGGLPPLFSPFEGATPLREDEANASLPREELLMGAPRQWDGYFVVPIAQQQEGGEG